MKKDSHCTFEDRRDEMLVGYLYDDIDAAEREAFERHLPACALCRAELDGLLTVRADIAAWEVPEPAAGVGGQAPRVPIRLAAVRPPERVSAGRTIPAWLQAAAAVLLVAGALGLANLEVSYAQGGVTVRTGWMHRGASVAAAAPPPQAAPAAASPWRNDLAALEQQLRAELAARPAASTATASGTDEALIRRVRALIAESERRQETELALRVAQVAREAQAQRQADLVRIDRSLGLMQSRTGVEVMRTQQQLNSLAQRVSQQP